MVYIRHHLLFTLLVVLMAVALGRLILSVYRIQKLKRQLLALEDEIMDSSAKILKLEKELSRYYRIKGEDKR